MKTVILQVTKHMLRLTPVSKSGAGRVFGLPVEFELPEKIKNGGSLSDLPYLAAFVKSSIKDTELCKSDVIFCLESDQMVTKEYSHIHIEKHEDLLKAARLESETVLHNDADDYVVTTAAGYTDKISGQEKSTLYAVPKVLVKNIIREFRQRGIKVVKITPPVAGLIYSCKTSLHMTQKNPVYQNKTIAVVDFSYEKSRLVIFSDGAPIYQKCFDSVHDEILAILYKFENMDSKKASALIKSENFLLNCGGSVSTGTYQRIKALIDASVGEIMRGIRAVLAVNRLETDSFIVCGAIALLPNFNKFLEKYLSGVPFENIACEMQKLKITAALSAGEYDFFTLNGVLSMEGRDNIDFMYEQNAAKAVKLRYVYASAVILAALLVTFGIQLFMYKSMSNNLLMDNNLLNERQIVNIKNLLGQSDKLDNEIKEAENIKKNMPFRKSKCNEVYTQVQKQVSPTLKITVCKIDNDAGKVDLQFTEKNIDDFNAVRKNIADSGYFNVLIPFTISSGTDKSGNYTCTTTLTVKDFTPLKILGKKSKTESGDGKN